MKRIFLALIIMMTIGLSANAMSYSQAREQALFLTDKMAYELNLTDEQYEAAYEINLDYLMSINSYDDLYSLYWRQRNADLRYILYSWQWDAYYAANYFYRPLYWDGGYWHFSVYARYPHRDYYYFGRPNIYITYRGGHSWRYNGGRSWYESHRVFDRYDRDRHFGMRDRFDDGQYGRGTRYSNGRFVSQGVSNNGFGQRTWGNDNRRSYDNGRQSSTRTTAERFDRGNSFGTRTFGNSSSSEPNRIFTPSQGSSRSDDSRPRNFNQGFGTRTFGSGSSSSAPRSFGGGSAPSGSRTFGSGSSSPAPRSFGGGSAPSGTRSFGSGSSSPTPRSFDGGSAPSSTRSFGSSPSSGSTRSFGGGNNGGGVRFGNRR